LLGSIHVPTVASGVPRCIGMAKVGVVYKVMPDKPGREAVDEVVGRLRERLSNIGVDIQDVQVEPVAFGLYSAKILIVVDEDDEAILNKVEELIPSVEGILVV